MSETPESETPEPEVPEETQQPEQYPADHPLVKALEAQKATIKDLKSKAKRLDDLEESQKTETQRLADRADAEFNRAQEAEAKLLRYEVASEQGIPATAMKFLTGTTREEIEASAKDVLALIGDSGKPRQPKPDPNQGRQAPEVATPAGQFASFLQQQLNNS